MNASIEKVDGLSLRESQERLAVREQLLREQNGNDSGFEKLIEKLSANFADPPANDIDGAIVECLGLITNFWNLDFGHLFQFASEEGPLQVTHTYRVPGAKSGFFESNPMIGSGHSVAVDHLMGDLPRDATVETSQVGPNLRSCLSIPLWNNERVFGLIQLGKSCDYRAWPAEILARLRLVGEIFAAAIARKRIEVTLDDSTELNRAVLNSLTSRVAVIDVSGKIIAVNDAWVEALNGRFNAAGKVGRNYYELCEIAFHSRLDKLSQLLNGIRSVVEGSLPFFEIEHTSTSDSRHTWLITAKPFKREGGGGAVISHSDITHCKLVDERLRDLSGRLITAQEEERSRIARDLHDDLNQRLALLSIDLERLQQNAYARMVQRQVHELWCRTQEISLDVQRLSYQLHPTKLNQVGLVAALKSYCDEIAQHHDLVVRFTHRDIPARLPGDVSLCIFRIVQEGLRNIVRHSDSETATIELLRHTDEIHLRLSDDGIGFDLELARASRGLGLVSMDERLRLIGGKISIQSQPGNGTSIEVAIKLRASASWENAEALSDSNI